MLTAYLGHRPNKAKSNRKVELLLGTMQRRQLGRSSGNNGRLDLLTDVIEAIEAELK